MMKYTLEELMQDIPAQFAAESFSGTSYDPEKRGVSWRRDYALKVIGFCTYLEEVATEASEEELCAEAERYRKNMKDAFMRYFSTHSHCISTFITGASNFPVSRAQRANNAADNALKAIIELDKNARASVKRRFYKDPNAPIRSDDPDALEKLQKRLAARMRYQERMKQANKAIRSAKGDNAVAREKLRELGYSEATAEELLTPDFAKRTGFPDFRLTNNNKEIHRLKARILAIQKLQTRPEESGENADGVRYEVDTAANRVKLFFPDKPSEEVRAKLKRNGFRWAPSNGAWQAFIHNYTISIAKELVGETTEP